MLHNPVMAKEVTDYLITDKSGVYFEGTLGFGGHSAKILNNLNPDGLLISTDVDKDAFNYSKEKFSGDPRIRIYNFNFDKVDVIAKIESLKGYNGVFADLGVSSYQLDNPESGFTYREEALLDLRLDKNLPLSAADVINTFSSKEIADIIYNLGEEKRSYKIANEIVKRRIEKKFVTTSDLADLLKSITPPNFHFKTLSRVFQALRIFVNDELTVLRKFLTASVDSLLPGGRIVVLSYHSLEDRIVKEIFKFEELDCVCPKDFPVCMCDKEQRLKILTKKPLLPGEDEVGNNPRARSAKLRVAERT